MSLKDGVAVDVVKAHWVGGYSLELEFSDGCTKTLDFGPFLLNSVQTDIRTYLDIDRFKGFSIRYGNLVWNDYDLCFPIEDLYSGYLDSGQEPSSLVAEDSPDYGRD